MIPNPVSVLLAKAEERLAGEFAALPDVGAFENVAADMSRIESVLEKTAARLGDNYPYFHQHSMQGRC